MAPLAMVNEARVFTEGYNLLASAIGRIQKAGSSVGYVMLDEQTGITLSQNADRKFFGASTVKAMWVTYLFQEWLEHGLIAWDEIADHVESCIAQSSNKSYTVLRSNYGTEQGFEKWLAQVGVGYIDSWDYYTPREQARVWSRMLAYTKSDGVYVDAWKSAFGHSAKSFVRETLGDASTVYSKPGWIRENDRRPNTYDDTAIVVGSDDRRYLVSIMSTMDPWGDCSPLCDLVAALDAIYREMPKLVCRCVSPSTAVLSWCTTPASSTATLIDISSM